MEVYGRGGAGDAIEIWLTKHNRNFTVATRHPFMLLLSIRSGSVDIASIKRWLGMSVLNDEIAWFKSEADKWGVSLSGETPQPANVNHCVFLESLMYQEVEYTVAITAFWAIETAYQESFAHCLEEDAQTPSELKETCQRWGNAVFGHYCHALKELANPQLSKASDDTLKKAEAAKVLDYEVDFWNMSYG